jgi:ornithine cyclodeaminase
VDALASPGEITLGLVGAGSQAYWHAAAIAAVRSVANVRVWARDIDKAEATAQRIRHDLSLPARAATLADAALAQVVVTATPAQVPILTKEILSPESVVVAMGADAIGKRELGPAILPQARAFVVDSLRQCERYGELQWLDRGSAALPVIELGALLARGERIQNGDGPVIFDSTGVAFQDAVGAELVLRKLEGSYPL